MRIQTDDTSMWVEGHPHLRAVATETGWHVSWLGGVLDQNRAMTAMVLAGVLTDGCAPGHRVWRHVESWSGELGLMALEARQMVQDTNDRAAQDTDVEGDAL